MERLSEQEQGTERSENQNYGKLAARARGH